MKKTIGILVSILALLVCAGALADVAIDETNFPDENFRQYIFDDGFDANGDGILDKSEISEVKSIVCDNKGVRTLKGIEYFTALESLSCCENKLISLDLSQNILLNSLWCQGNQLTSLDLSGNPALTGVECWNNELTSLNVSENKLLTGLWCNQNKLSKLDVSKNTNLEMLWCEENQLKKLDVKNNTSLLYLYCKDNKLSTLDISNNTALTNLSCEYNQLKSLKIGKNKSLKNLDCHANKIKELNVKECTALIKLDCGYNIINSLDVRKNKNLLVLRCWNNQITELDVRKNKSLSELWCDVNSLTNLDVSYCPKLVDVLETKKKKDRGMSWEFGENADRYPLVAFDKTVKVYLGNGKYYDPNEKPSKDISDDTLKYRIKENHATVIGIKDNDAVTVKIPDVVKYGGKTYKVTEIKDSTFKGMKNLASVSIGKNVSTIGKNAFNGCTALKSITIKTKKLTADSVGSNAFKDTPKKATIKVPKDKVDEYKALLRTKGVNKKAKIKK